MLRCFIFQGEQLLHSAPPLGNLGGGLGAVASDQDDAVLHQPAAVVVPRLQQGVALLPLTWEQGRVMGCIQGY